MYGLMTEEPKGNVYRSGWKVIGYYMRGKCECCLPIGIYSDRRDAEANANAWARQEKRHTRVDIEPAYEEIFDAE